MNRRSFVFIALIALVAGTGAMVYVRQRTGASRATAYVGEMFGVVTPTPTFGEIALQDVGSILKRVLVPSVEPNPSSSGAVRTLEGGLQVQDVSGGSGAEAISGTAVSVQYTGWHLVQGQDGSFRKGEPFDSSVGRGKPFTFVLGSGSVIRGWDIGLVGMRVGGRRLLVIPPALAYGTRGAGDVIKPNEALLFEVELVSVDAGSSRQ